MVAPAVIAAIPAVLQLASSVMEGFSNKKQKKAYAEYQEKTRQAAMQQYRYQTRAINNRLAEEEEASDLQLEQTMIKNLQAKATASASAAGSGITGSTIDNLFKDYDRASAMNNYIASRNLHLKGLQAADEKEAAYIQAMNTINLQQQYTGGTFGMSLLSGIGNAAATYVQNYHSTTSYTNSNNGKRADGINLLLNSGGSNG
jgi:hypothetical protein